MKQLRFQIPVSFLLFLVLSCQQEVPFEETTASGTLKSNSTGDCLPMTVNGTYKKDTALGNSNYIEIQAHILNAGSFVIHSDTVNGYFFNTTANVTDTGFLTVRLYGHGTPTGAGINNFTIKFGSSNCSALVTVTEQVVNTNAVFTLGVSGNNCTGATIAGTYMSGLAMNSFNNVKIDVTVSTPGTFSINTNTLNGVTFLATGNFSTTGNQQVTLYASGIPSGTGTFNYLITAGTAHCQFPVTYSSSSLPAIFTTTSTSGLCSPITVNGTYKAGVPLNAINTVVIEVNVSSPGTYSITTAPSVNGMVFNGAGTFTTTGLRSVILYGTGTPIAQGTNIYTIAGTSGCTFPVITQNNGGSATGIFTCKIDGVFTTFNIDAHAFMATPGGFGQAIEITGNATTSGAEKMNLDINRTEVGTLIVPGTYGEGFSTKIAQIYYYTPATAFWYGISTIHPVTIIITSISGTNVKGTFTGKVYDSGGFGPGFKTITEGIFDVPVQ